MEGRLQIWQIVYRNYFEMVFLLDDAFAGIISSFIVLKNYEQIWKIVGETRVQSGSGRVFLGSGIWPKYGAGFWKTKNILTGFGIWLLPGKRDSPKFGYGMRDFVACLSGIRKTVTTQKTVIAAKANQPGERKISIERASLHLKFIRFCRN